MNKTKQGVRDLNTLQGKKPAARSCPPHVPGKPRYTYKADGYLTWRVVTTCCIFCRKTLKVDFEDTSF